jgi:ADP-ribose pyrophosphatase YjhB (NUDIX family)
MSQPDPSTVSHKPRLPISIGAGAVVVHNELVLLVRNRFGVTKGRYLLPAGTVKLGEAPDKTAVRETLEETNLHIEVRGYSVYACG